MAEATADLFETTALRLKGGMVSVTTLEIRQFEPESFLTRLREEISRTPRLFDQLPILLNLDQLETGLQVEQLKWMREQLRQLGPILIGLSSDRPDDMALARAMQLPCFPRSKSGREAQASTRENPAVTPQPVPEEQASAKTAAGPHRRPRTLRPGARNLTIRQPVRSGQQIYAQGGDLIVLAPVSAGAEVLADGNIHIYGALRGRALAGVRGCQDALIFCQSLEAELVSIAGHYKVNEDLAAEFRKQAIRIGLHDEKLTFTNLS